MDDIDAIIGKKLADEPTADELAFLEKWRTGSPENERYFREMEQLWQRAPAPLPRPLDVESALKKTKARIAAGAAPPVRPIGTGRVFQLKTWWFAAAAAVAVAVAAVVFFQKTAAAPPVELAATDAPIRGTLADGSKIALNRHSKIRAGISRKTRRVELQGEAFFEVAHDAARPFSVLANGLEITAVGTAFNVDENGAGRVTVRMAEGKARLAVVGLPANNIRDGQTIFLSAGEEAVFDEKSGEVLTQKMSPVSPADGWFSRRFAFDGASLGEVLPVLEKAYSVRISLKNNELAKCKLRTRFSNEPIERIVEVLAETFSLKVERAGDGYVLDGAGCE